MGTFRVWLTADVEAESGEEAVNTVLGCSSPADAPFDVVFTDSKELTQHQPEEESQ